MNDLIIIQNIQDKIYEIRGQRVMLDRDIAAFYGVEPKRLNEKVKRNPKRFAGEDFMFQLTSEELADLRSRSQNATLKRHPIGFIQPKDEEG
ncbi:MAG: ORF6N domain-containing protein [Bacteroidaceae bacterium]|nr:ORF6N domain-containing protein [Bacteroidaceae bacterium]